MQGAEPRLRNRRAIASAEQDLLHQPQRTGHRPEEIVLVAEIATDQALLDAEIQKATITEETALQHPPGPLLHHLGKAATARGSLSWE